MKPYRNQFLRCASLRPALAIASIICVGNSVNAASDTWGADADGEWGTAGSWVGNQIPGSVGSGTGGTSTTDDAIFDGAGNYTVYTAGNRGIEVTTFSNTGTTAILGGTTATAAGASLYIFGNLTVNAGAGAVTIGDTAASPTRQLVIRTGSQTYSNNSSNLLTLANAIQTRGTGGLTTITFTGAGNTLLTGAVGGGGGASIALNKSGNGILSLSGANTYGSGTAITAGTLTFLNTASKSTSGSGNHVFSGGTTLGLGVATTGTFFNAADVTSAFALTGVGTGNLARISTTATTNVGIDTTAGDFTYATSVAGSPTKGLTKLGANTLFVSGANSYTGVTSLVAGNLNVSDLTNYGVSGALGNRASASEAAGNIGIRFMGGTLQYTGTTAQSTDRQIRIGTAGGTIDASGTGSGTVSFTHNASNTDLFDTAGSRSLTLTGSNAGDNIFAIGLTDQNASTGKTSLTKSGIGTWLLSNAGTFSGNTIVTGGTLKLTNNLAIQNSPFDTSGAGSLDTTAINTPTFGGLIGAGNYTISSNVTNLTLNPIGGTVTYTGNLSGGATGLTLTKSGAGTQILGGTNTYSGDTIINAGSLVIQNSAAIGGSAVTMSGTGNSALLLKEITAGSGKSVTLVGAGVEALYGALSTVTTNVFSEWQGGVTIGATTLTRVGSQGGTLKISGNIGESTIGSDLIVRNFSTGATVLSGANTFSGNLSIFHGVLRVGGDSVGSVGSITSGPLGRGTLISSSTAATLTAEGATARTILNPITFTGNNTLTLGSSSTDTGKLTFNAAFTRTGGNTINTASDVEFDGGATSSTLNRLNINNGTTTVSSGSYDLNGYLTVNTLATGPANYLQTGGTVTLSNATNGAYVGNVTSSTSTLTVSGGELNVNNTDGLIMRFDGTATTTVSGSGSISSTGTGGLSFQKTGSTGTFNLGDGTTFSGGTSGVFTTSKVVSTSGTSANNIFNFNGGTLKASAATFAFSSTDIAANVMAAGGIIDNGDFDITVGQNLLNGGGTDGGMAFKGTGITTLTGASTFNGPTAIKSGTLALGATGNIANSASMTIAAGAKLETILQPTYTIPAGKPVTFSLSAAGAGASGQINAAGLDISTATVLFDVSGPLDDAAYVLATYTSKTGSTFASVTPPSGYQIDYAFNGGTQIALVPAGPSGYGTWASTNAGGQTANLDFDNDGVANGVEYFMGQTGSSFTSSPSSFGGTTATWTNGGSIPANQYGTQFVIQTSTDLVIWNPVLVGDPYLNNQSGSVAYTLNGTGKQFVRLLVTPN